MKIVGLRLSKHVVERGQLHSWPLFDEREDRLSRPLVDRWRLDQVIIQETEIALEDPVDLARRAQPIQQAELRCEAFAWRASPVTYRVSAIAVRHGLAETFQPGVRLPLLPADPV